MDKFETVAGQVTKGWVKPELKRLSAGSAENAPTRVNADGNAGTDPANSFQS